MATTAIFTGIRRFCGADNTAKRLYVSRGFVAVGRVEDRFRVDGVPIEEVQMTLAVA